jgi:exonuclease VII small subunit
MKKQTYSEAYATLKAVADRLRNGGPADVDGLVEAFRTAKQAYLTCRERLEQIRREIEDELDHTGGDKGGLESDPFAA